MEEAPETKMIKEAGSPSERITYEKKIISPLTGNISFKIFD